MYSTDVRVHTSVAVRMTQAPSTACTTCCAFLDYQLPYRAHYLQSTDCLLRPCSTAAGDSCLAPVRVAQGACKGPQSKCLTATKPQYDSVTTVKTSSAAQTFHLAAYKTTAHRRCVNVQFNDDYSYLVMMPWSLLQSATNQPQTTWRHIEEGGHHSQVIGGVKKTNGVTQGEEGRINRQKKCGKT